MTVLLYGAVRMFLQCKGEVRGRQRREVEMAEDESN
jgi:hypothetical protein